jgi:hypothetical protein
MTIYTATFRTADTWATAEITARTPEQAMRKARRLAETNIESLGWCVYDPSSVPLEEIKISGPRGDGPLWQSADLALRVAAGDLLAALDEQTEAAQAVIDAWETGDLAGAVRSLNTMIDGARAAIAKAKGGAP